MGYRCCLLWRERPKQAALQSPWGLAAGTPSPPAWRGSWPQAEASPPAPFPEMCRDALLQGQGNAEGCSCVTPGKGRDPGRCLCCGGRQSPRKDGKQHLWAPGFCSPDKTTLLTLSAAAQALCSRCCFCARLSLLHIRRPTNRQLHCVRMCEIQRLSLQLCGKAHHLLHQACQPPARADER